jgi:hypothetical protein
MKAIPLNCAVFQNIKVYLDVFSTHPSQFY